MGIIDDDSLQEMYDQFIQAFNDSCVVECKIEYQTDERTFDSVNQVWVSSGSPKDESIIVYVIDNEEKRNGMAMSSNIIEGVPTGTHKLYIPFENAIFVDKIDNYVDKSLKFILRPNSLQPITLYPDIVMSKIEYFMENENMPVSQRFICSVIKV